MTTGRINRARPTLATTCFGHDLLWPRPALARPTLATARPTLATVNFLAFLRLRRRVGARRVVNQGARSGRAPRGRGLNWWGPEGVGGPRGGEPQGLGPKGLGPKVWARRVGSPKFRAFFSFSRSHFHSFFLSLGVFVEFWWCFGRSGPQMCLFFAFKLSCESPRQPSGRRGFTGQPESPNVHISWCRNSKTPPESHERTPKRGRK